MAVVKQKGMGLLCPVCKSMSAKLVLNRKTNQRECRKLGCGYFELNDDVCKKYCRCAKCFATKDEHNSISFWSY